MQTLFGGVLFVLATIGFARAQTVIGIDDLDPMTGTVNAFPWNTTGGQTSLHVYSAQTLRALGVCAGSLLTEFEVAPAMTGSGVYNAPQAKLEIGHLAVSPPIAGNWASHLASPSVIHDLTSGPYTFPWTSGTYTQLPGFATAAFVWDGVTDIGIQYTSSAGVTGNFSARRTATQLRHYVAVFNATSQAPSTNGPFAMEARMTWSTAGICASRDVYGAGCDTPPLTLLSNFPRLGTTFVLTATQLHPIAPFGLMMFGDAQVVPPLDLGFLGAPTCRAHTNANLSSMTFPVAAGSGAVSIALPAAPVLVGVAIASQAVGFTTSTPIGLATSNGLFWTIGN